MMGLLADRRRATVASAAIAAVAVLGAGTFASNGYAKQDQAKRTNKTNTHHAKKPSRGVLQVATISFGAGGKEKALATASDRVVYLVTGDSAKTPGCDTSVCHSFWHPVTVKRATAKVPVGAGVKGKVAVWRHNGINQVTISGHPLYTFGGERQKLTAIVGLNNNFGPGKWRTVRPSGAPGK